MDKTQFFQLDSLETCVTWKGWVIYRNVTYRVEQAIFK